MKMLYKMLKIKIHLYEFQSHSKALKSMLADSNGWETMQNSLSERSYLKKKKFLQLSKIIFIYTKLSSITIKQTGLERTL